MLQKNMVTIINEENKDLLPLIEKINKFANEVRTKNLIIDKSDLQELLIKLYNKSITYFESNFLDKNIEIDEDTQDFLTNTMLDVYSILQRIIEDSKEKPL